MSRIKVMVGVLCAAGLCIAALGASSASALTLHECGDSSTPGATVISSGCPIVDGKQQVHIPISGPQTVKPTGTANSVLKITVGGVNFQIVCTGMSGTGTAENVTSGDGKHMGIAGSGITVTYENCAVTEPVKCAVPTSITTNSLKSETVTATDKQKYTPTSGTVFVTINVTGAECPVAFKGEKNVTGSAVSVNNETTGEQEFTTTSGSELKFGGQNATFTSKNTFDTSNGTQVKATTP